METHVCPYWVGYFLINPLRKYAQNPEKILKSYIKPGMIIIDYGCAMGYFSIPMARLAGNSGKVYCFDIQEKMLKKLEQRAKKANVGQIVKPVLINSDGTTNNKIKGMADFALLFAVAHEVPDRQKLFTDLHQMMKTDRILLFAEPKGHVTLDEFEKSVGFAEIAGFEQIKSLNIRRSHAVLLKKVK